MDFSFFSVCLFIFCFISYLKAEIIYEGNSTNEFSVTNFDTVEIPNPFRSPGRIKISFTGTNITRVIRKDSNFWFLNDTFNDIAINVRQTKLVTNQSVEYNFNWFNYASHHDHQHEICFHVGFNGATWFTTFLEKSSNFPFKISKSSNFSSFTPNSGSLGAITENLLFNTDGFAVALDPSLPLAVKFVASETSDPKLCFAMAFLNPDLVYNDFSFYLVLGENIQQVHNLTVNKEHFIQESNYRIPDARLFSETIWNLDSAQLNQTEILNHVALIHHRGYEGIHVVLENWEAHYGDLDFDKKRFVDPKKFVHDLKQLGNSSLSLRFQPFVSNVSIFYETHRNYLIREFIVNSSNHDNPLMAFQLDHHSGGLFDLTDNFLAYELLWSHLYNLRRKLEFDSYHFAGGDFELGRLGDKIYHRKRPAEHYANLYAESYGKFAERLGRLATVDSGYHNQNSALFMRMLDLESNSWDSLRSMLHSVLTLSISGYSYMIPSTFQRGSTKPSEELYIRWVQACALLPSMQFSIPPWEISNKTVEITKKMVDLHAEHAPAIIELARLASKGGEPLVRPLWYIAPNDPKTFTIGDQFGLGNDILVAPVLVQGIKERTVYLTTGAWVDQHGKSYTGPGEFKVATPLEDLIYFKRKF